MPMLRPEMSSWCASVRTPMVIVLALGSLVTACAEQPPPATAPSGEFAGYADRYPARIGAERAAFDADEERIQKQLPELQKVSEPVKGADDATLVDLYELADQDGRSGSYAGTALEGETVARFFEEEKQPLHQKIAGSVSYAAKEKNCSEDLGGSAAYATDRAVEKQLEERLKDHSEAQRFLEDNEDQLGKQNTDLLSKRAALISELSYLSHVRLELRRRELEEDLKESSQVKSTLDRTVEESNAVLADANASKGRKAAAERRKKAAEAARAQLDGEVKQAEDTLKGIGDRQKKIAAEYDQAYAAVIDAIEDRIQK